MNTKLILILIVCCTAAVYGQESCNCDTVYIHTEVRPQYNTGERELFKYISDELIPIIQSYIQPDNVSFASKLLIVLTIDCNGQVMDVVVNKPELSEQCRADLKEKVKTMTGWKAGKINNRPVCSHFTLFAHLDWKN